MDTYLLLIFLLTSCWLYAVILLAILDWRWNLGRIILFSLFAGVGTWLILSGRMQPGWGTTLAVLFAVTVFGPALAQRLVVKLILTGRESAARRCHRLLRLFTWPLGHDTFDGLVRVHAEMSRAIGTELARHPLRQLLARIHAARSRRAFLTYQIEAYAYMGKYLKSVEVFERDYVANCLKPTASLLYTMVIPYCERGDLREAIRCLSRAERAEKVKRPRDLKRFLAHLRVFALTGRVKQLESHLGASDELVARLSPAYIHLWRGVALMRSGRKDEAWDALNQATIHAHPAEHHMRDMIEQRLAELSESASRLELSADTQRELDALEQALKRQPEEPEFLSKASAPTATVILVTASILVWVLMEALGSSGDARTLLRFGANVPELVKGGEWWRLVSSVFLHVAWWHLFFNVFGCYIFGKFVERVAGPSGVLTVFMFSGLCGSIASALLGDYTLSAGASGAVFGLLGAALVLVARLKTAFPPYTRKLYIFSFAYIAAINMIYGLVAPQIDNLAHGGGFVAGVATALLVAPMGAGKVRKNLIRLAAAAMIALAGISAFHVYQNARAGSYPARIPPLKEYTSPWGSWKLRVPVFWDIEGESLTGTSFVDPMGGPDGPVSARVWFTTGYPAKLSFILAMPKHLALASRVLELVAEPRRILILQSRRALTGAARTLRAFKARAPARGPTAPKRLTPRPTPRVDIVAMGKRHYRRTRTKRSVRGQAIARLVFEPIGRGEPPHALLFECAWNDWKLYQPLLARILESVRFQP